MSRLRIALLIFGLASNPVLATETKPISITGDGGTAVFLVEIATSAQERGRGLMYRRTMADDAGMIFDFGSLQPITMWMRNTYISLDMIFIDDAGRIGHIVENTTPLSDTIISSRVDARFVLEIKGGSSRRLGLQIGDRVHGPAIDDLR